MARGSAALLSFLIVVITGTGLAQAGVPGEVRKYDPPNATEHDRLLGFKPRPSIRIHDTKIVDGKTIFDTHYTIDRFSRRVTPNQGGKRDRFMLFFGCSFMYGEGIEDNETLPYFMSREMPGFRVYNYGYSAYGAQQMLARLRAGKIPSEVKEKKGIALYYFLDHHIDRTIGTLDIVSNWSPMPYYALDSSGKVVRVADTFAEGKPFYRFLSQFGFIRRLAAHIRPWITHRDLEFFSELLAESKQSFEAQFPGSRFVVVLAPRWADQRSRRLIPFLERKHVEYLNYSGTREMNDPSYNIPGDGHPTGKGNEHFAGMLSKDLRRIAGELN